MLVIEHSALQCPGGCQFDIDFRRIPLCDIDKDAGPNFSRADYQQLFNVARNTVQRELTRGIRSNKLPLT